MSAALNLHPSGYLETLDSCSGPTRVKTTSSRESYSPTLNDFMEKYANSTEYTDQTFIQTLETLKRFSRNWPKLHKNVQKEILQLLLEGNGKMSESLKIIIDEKQDQKKKEHFGNQISLEKQLAESKTSDQATQILNSFLENLQESANGKVLNDVKCITNDNRNSIFIIIVSVIISLLIGFLSAYNFSK